METIELVVNGYNGIMEFFKGDEEIDNEKQKLQKLIESINNKLKIYQDVELLINNKEILNLCKQITEK